MKSTTYEYSDVELDEFSVISEWYHFPIVELTLTENFQNSPQWIANQLGISVIEAKNGIERLLRVGLLIEEDDTLSPSSQFYVNQSSIPNESIKKYHKQVLEKAILAIDQQATDIRDYGVSTIAINSKDIPYVKAKLKEFRLNIDKELSAGKNRNYVYTLSTQFFCMQKNTPN